MHMKPGETGMIQGQTQNQFLVPGTCNNFAGIENGDLTGGKKRFFRMRKRESSGCAK